MRFHDGDFDKKEREKRENSGLDEADEDFEGHKRHGAEVREEVDRDRDQDFAGKNVAEETEGKGDEPRELGEKFDDADDETHRRVHIEEFAAVFDSADRENASDLDDEKRDEGKRERNVEIGIGATQKRDEISSSEEADTADAGDKFEHVGGENKKEDGSEERKKAPRHRAALERLGNVVIHVAEKFLKNGLEAARYQFHPAPDDERDEHEDSQRDPAHKQRVGERDPPKRPELLRREYDLNSLIHKSRF